MPANPPPPDPPFVPSSENTHPEQTTGRRPAVPVGEELTTFRPFRLLRSVPQPTRVLASENPMVLSDTSKVHPLAHRSPRQPMKRLLALVTWNPSPVQDCAWQSTSSQSSNAPLNPAAPHCWARQE